MTDKKTIKADPSKTFFIDILTRDISLKDCILDLIDNSIDSLVQNFKLNIMNTLLGKDSNNETKYLSKAVINVDFTSNNFIISDNCAGISIESASSDVFKFGSDKSDLQQESNGLSVYGIGMKRAIFKIGKIINIESTTTDENFTVDIDVIKWQNDLNNWKFEFTSTKKGIFKNTGTKISITKVNEDIKRKLGLKSFEYELIEKIKSTYSLFISKGLQINVNGIKVPSHLPTISHSDDLRPAVKKFNYKDVDILIMVGLSEFTDKYTKGGWYVFCNGRMVLESDQTQTTGWGRKLPKFHSKYNHFIGYTYFQSKNVYKLPWKTSKDNIETESEVYQFALNHMAVNGKLVTNFLNKIYPSEASAKDVIEKTVYQKAKSKSIENISSENSDFTVNLDVIELPDMVTISYSKPKDKVLAIAKHLGNKKLSFKEVGSMTFDYYYSMEIDY